MAYRMQYYISMKTTYQIKASNTVSDLQGIGAEALLDANGEVIAMFWNGSMSFISSNPSQPVSQLTDEPTLVLAA